MPKENPFDPTWMSWSRMQAWEDPKIGCPKKYHFYSLGLRKKVQSAAAQEGSAMHDAIEKGIIAADFSDPIFTSKKCTFLAKNMLSVEVEDLFPVSDTKGVPAYERPDPELLKNLAPELDLSKLKAKVHGVKIFGYIDVARFSAPWAVITDWKKSDFSRSRDQLSFYAMVLRENVRDVKCAAIHQYYLKPYKKGEYFDRWVLSMDDLDAEREKFQAFLAKVKGSINFEPKPCQDSCVDAFGGAGCDYKEHCPYAWGKHHRRGWDDYDVLPLPLSERITQALDDPKPGLLGFGFNIGFGYRETLHPLQFIQQFNNHVMKVLIPGDDSRYLWANDFNEAVRWLRTVLNARYAEKVAPLKFNVLDNGIVSLEEPRAE